ncbi:MAG: hypothetical protein ACRD2U_11740 [Terriglobales bacterium]
MKYTPQFSACGGPIRTDASGRYLYAVGCYNNLATFAINPNGDLTSVSSPPLPVAAPTFSLAVTP